MGRKAVSLSALTKRDGRLVSFDRTRIEQALRKCFIACGEEPNIQREQHLTQKVINLVYSKVDGQTPDVELVQDAVESVLFSSGYFQAAKAYILFRKEKEMLRQERAIPTEVREAFARSAPYFKSPLEGFQFYSKYSRFDWVQGRRETWEETVARSVAYLHELAGDRLPGQTYEDIERAILRMEVMPSMRLLSQAGAPARRNNLAIYNCSYLPVEDMWAFCEALFLSMSGCGVGFSVERKYVEKFPRIKRQRERALWHMWHTPEVYTVPDTTEGWVGALITGLEHWFNGEDIFFDYSELRPAGAPLITKGGRASGPEPLRYMLDFTRSKILARQGTFLRPIDAHDIMCAVGHAAVSGGVRRTAMISLFDWDDDDMRLCKSGNFEEKDSQRWNANNSAVWEDIERMDQLTYIQRFSEMVASGRGEPGIFNRDAARMWIPTRREVREFGTNPCGEIILRPYQLCNLSIAVARPDDTPADLKRKVELATTIGTIQSTATTWPILRPEWKKNCDEERLLGVDITGQMDCPAVQDPAVMLTLMNTAVNKNKEIAAQLGINQSAAVTCVKPSGNSSQLLNCSSGLHPRFAKYYIRNVREHVTSPVFKMLRDNGVPYSPENGQTLETMTTAVFHFPVKSPEGAITRHDRSAIEQCEYWLMNKQYWTEHNPSVTITYRPDEVLDLLRWVWDHKQYIGGMAFLPVFDAKYDLLPYVEIDEEAYNALALAFPKIDFSKIYQYELDDMTTASQELACMAGVCDWLPQA